MRAVVVTLSDGTPWLIQNVTAHWTTPHTLVVVVDGEAINIPLVNIRAFKVVRAVRAVRPVQRKPATTKAKVKRNRA